MAFIHAQLRSLLGNAHFDLCIPAFWMCFDVWMLSFTVPRAGYLEQDGRSQLQQCRGIQGDVLSRQCPSRMTHQVPPPQELPLPGALQWVRCPHPHVAARCHVVPPPQVLPHLMPPLALLIVALVPAPQPWLLGLVDHGVCDRSGVLCPAETKGKDTI